MKNKKKWKQLIALALSAVMLFPAQAAYAENGTETVTEPVAEAVSETTEADFIIKDGILTQYNGEAKRVIIPDGVTEISHAAFYSDDNMEYLYMPDSVTTIRDQAFRFCDALQEIRFSENLTVMEFSAFEGCYDLHEIILPDSLTQLPQYAFHVCSEVRAVRLPENLREIDISALAGMDHLNAIEMPDSLMSVDKTAFDSTPATLIVSEGSVAEQFAAQCDMDYVHKGTAKLQLEKTGMGDVEISDGEKLLSSGDTVRIGQLVYISARKQTDDLQVLANGKDLVYPSLKNGLTQNSDNPYLKDGNLINYPYVITGDTLLQTSFVNKAATVNESLNIPGGNLDFTYSDVEPVVFQGRRMAQFQSGSAELSLTVNNTADQYISFDFCNKYWSDHVYFKIDDTVHIIPTLSGQRSPLPIAFKIPAGKHVLTWDTEINYQLLQWGVTDVNVYISNVFFTSDVNMLTANHVSTSQKVIDLKIGESDIVTYSTEPEILSEKAAEFSSTNTNVVSVEPTGRVTGLARGKSVIKINLDGKTASVPVYVSKYVRKGEYEYDGNVLMGYFGSEAVLELPKDVQTIGEYAFAGHKELGEVTLPDTVKSIGAYAFSDCMGLKRIHIPTSITEIGKRAFPKDAVLLCDAGSAAYEYALANNLHYELPDGTSGVGEAVETVAPIVNETEITQHTSWINSREIYVPNDVENTYVCDGKGIYRYHIAENRFEEKPIVTPDDSSYTTAVRGSVIYIKTNGEASDTSHIIGYHVMKDKIVYEQDFPICAYGEFAVDDERNFFFTDNGIDLYIYDELGNKTSEEVTSNSPLTSNFGSHQISQVDPYNRVLLSTYLNTMGRAVHYEESYTFSGLQSALDFGYSNYHFIGYKAYRNGTFISTSNFIKNPNAIGYSKWCFFDGGAYAVNAAGQIVNYKKVQDRTPGIDYDVLYQISDVDVYSGKRPAACKVGDIVYIANDIGKIYAFNVENKKMAGLYTLPDSNVQALYAVDGNIYVRYTRAEKEYIANLQCSEYSETKTIQRNQHITLTYEKDDVLSRYLQCISDVDYTKENNIFQSLPNSKAPYAAGQLSQAVKAATLTNLNYARWQSGLNEISIYEEYMERSQKGAVLMAANRELTHEPSQPADMEDEFYQEGCAGVGADISYSGNISRGNTMPESVFGYLDDIYNVSKGIGHRLSLLDKTADRTSFGYCQSYSAMSMYYAENPGSLGNDEDFYAWPSAGYFPTEAISPYASWHIITDFYKSENPHVDLTYDGKTFTVNEKALYYNRDYNALYFDLPNELLKVLLKNNYEFKDNATVDVKLAGLLDKDGNPIEVSYPVRFVEAISNPDSSDENGGNGGNNGGNNSGNNGGSGNTGGNGSTGGNNGGNGNTSGNGSTGGNNGGNKDNTSKKLKYIDSRDVEAENLIVGQYVTDKKSAGQYRIAKVTKTGKTVTGGTLEFISPIKTSCKKISIPSTIKLCGLSFKVTVVKAKAFTHCQKLTSVKIGKNVTSIGTKAFYGCRKLGLITVKSAGLKKVGKNALKGIKATAKVKVPKKKLQTYKKLFKNKGQGKKVKITA